MIIEDSISNTIRAALMSNFCREFNTSFCCHSKSWVFKASDLLLRFVQILCPVVFVAEIGIQHFPVLGSVTISCIEICYCWQFFCDCIVDKNIVMEKVDVIRLIRTILDGSNYAIWSQKMSNFLKGRRLGRIVTGSVTKPIK